MSDSSQRAADLVRVLHADIPLTAAMQLSVKSFDGKTLVFKVPLMPNVND